MEFNCENTTPMAFSVGRKGIVAYEATHQEKIEWDFETDDYGNAIPIEEPKLKMTNALMNVIKCAECMPVDDDKKVERMNARSAAGIRSDYFDLNQHRKYTRTSRKVRNLCRNNFHEDNALHVILTFDSKKFPQKDFHDLETARSEFRKFIKRMDEHYDNFRHVSVYARQDNGRWHFHMLCNLATNTSKEIIRKIWGLGRCTIKKIKDWKGFTNLVNYLCQNLRKNFDEFAGKRAFAYSKGLQDNLHLRQWKLNENYVMAEILDLVNSGDIKIVELDNSFYLYGTLEKYWKPIIMATLKETKFKHKKYRPKTRKKKGGGANVTEKSRKDG